MDQAVQATKADEERARTLKRLALKSLNQSSSVPESSKLDSSLKRHTALIKRMRLSLAADNRDHILKDIDTLTLEKYIEEIAGAAVDGIARCKTEKDVWSATEIVSALHRRFPNTFTPVLNTALLAVLAAPNRAALAALAPEQREKEDSTRVSRQRPVLRLCAELALVGIIKDGPHRSGAETIMRTLKDLLSGDSTLSSLPLLSTFLKSYARPFLGISPPAPPSAAKNGDGDATAATDAQALPEPGSSTNAAAADEPEELVEPDIRDRFKRMCEGYFESVSKKLVLEHKKLQDQDRRNHEAYIRSGEIFEDRQQAYEKMTKGYEKLLASCQTLSELLYLPMPHLPAASHKTDSIIIGSNTTTLGGGEDIATFSGGPWEDEEERRFFEDLIDLKDFVPKSCLGIEEGGPSGGDGGVEGAGKKEETEKEQEERAKKDKENKEQADEDARKMSEELEKLKLLDGEKGDENGDLTNNVAKTNGHEEGMADNDDDNDDDDDVATPMPSSPKATSPTQSPHLAPQGPSQLLTALLVRLPEATNRSLIDQAAIDFAFLNSKAARKRLVKFLGQVPKNRTDLLPHYSRLVATLNKYMPDVGSGLVGLLDDEFRYLQRKKNVVKELAEMRLKNITFLSNLTKFRIVPTHVILHIFKVCLDDFSGTNVDNMALLLEGCGRFLLRSEETRERFTTMIELMRRKQSLQHFDQRQVLLLENAYYQCNPPERGPRQLKERTPMELFIRHIIYDVLSKKTIDKALKLIRKLDWDSPTIRTLLHKIFIKPWKIKYSNVGLLAMLTYDLMRYHPDFSVAVVDQVLEDVRRGLEQNVYSYNQRRVATIKFLGELYIYRMLSSSIIFDTFWTLVTFGHPEGRPLPKQVCPIDMPDDFFRIRLVCVLLDTCGMVFDRGSSKKKLDNFLVFFQYYVKCKDELPMDIDFMLSDSLEAVRPNLVIYKDVEEAANAVDEMLQNAFQSTGADDGAEDSAEGSDNDEDDDGGRREEREEEDIGDVAPGSPTEERGPSPEPVFVHPTQEYLGPSEEAEAEFERELAKMVTDASSESRKVDKKTALALWDQAVVPPGYKKKLADEDQQQGEEDTDKSNFMNFTFVTKKGNKPQLRQLAVPAASALAVHTQSAQEQERVEQQQLKRLVLDYEQREEAEELKAQQIRNKFGGVKIRYVG